MKEICTRHEYLTSREAMIKCYFSRTTNYNVLNGIGNLPIKGLYERADGKIQIIYSL